MSNSLSVSLISHALVAVKADQAKRNAEKVKAFAIALELLNGDMPATVDAQGRLHAPCSGYQSECGHVYEKGQFIPVHVDEYQGTERNKFRVTGDDFIAALQADDELSSSVGTTWLNNDGVKQANLYLEVAKGEEQLVTAVVRDVEGSYGFTVVEHMLDGKDSVQGTIVSLWQRSSEYGVQNGMTVQLDDGAIYQGTLPKTAGDADKGDGIVFSATFTKGSAYFKRPSKAMLVKGQAKAA